MASGHHVHVSEDCVGLAADEANNKVVVEHALFDRTRNTLCLRVELRHGRTEGLIYMTALEVMRLAKELRALAIAAFEDV